MRSIFLVLLLLPLWLVAALGFAENDPDLDDGDLRNVSMSGVPLTPSACGPDRGGV
jgi:hypothetical protein